MDASVDGRWILGLNSLIDPSLLKQGEYAWSQNVDNTGGILQTRQGFNAVGVKNGNLPPLEPKGATWFRDQNGNHYLVIAIGAEIYASMFPLLDEFHRIGGGFFANSPVYFCRTLQSVILKPDGTLQVLPKPIPWLVMQNGVETAKAWSGGQIKRQSVYGVNPGMPIGSFMQWSGERLWIAKGHELMASDLGNPLSFYEASLVSGGGSLFFDDEITGMAQTTDLQNLLVCTGLDTSAIQSNILDRTQWGNTPGFQRVILPGVGCAAAKSFVRQWGVTWWMTYGGFVGIDQALMTYQRSRIQYRDQQMMRAKEKLNGDISGICAESFGNYLMVSTPYASKYNTGTWVLNQRVLDISSPTPLQDLSDPAAWASQWTGIQPVEYIHCVVDGKERLFALSRHFVGNHVQPVVWEMFTGERQDRYNDATYHPPCLVETRLLGFSDDLKTFHYADVDVSELLGVVDFQTYVAGRKGNYHKILDKRIVASEGSVNASLTSPVVTTVAVDAHTGDTTLVVDLADGFLTAPAILNVNGLALTYNSVVDNVFTLSVPLNSDILKGTQVIQPQFQYPNNPTILTSYTPQRRLLKSQEWDIRKGCSSCGVESQYNENVDRGFSLLFTWHGRLAIVGTRIMTEQFPQAQKGRCEPNEETARAITQTGCGINSTILENPTTDSGPRHSQYLHSVTHRPIEDEAYNPIPV